MNRPELRTIRGCLVASAFCAACWPAHAQNAVPAPQLSRSIADSASAESVTMRLRPDYDAPGISAGGFRVYTSARVSLLYDDNVYDADDGKVTDGAVVVSPRVTGQSTWSRHGLNMTAGGQFERYFNRATESNDQYDFGATGRLDAADSAVIDGGTSYARRVEPRGAVGDIFPGGNRIRYDVTTTRLRLTKGLRRLLVTAGGGFSSVDYLPVRIGGVDVSQDYRDRRETTATTRVDLVLNPAVRTFLSADLNRQHYLKPSAALNPNSRGFSLLGGVAFGFSDLISGEIGIGYVKQFYRQPGQSAIGAVGYNARVTWNPTRLLTVVGTASRTIQQSPFTTQSGVLQNDIKAIVDYELLRNLIITANIQYLSSDFRGLDRKDKLWVVEAQTRYLANRWLEGGVVLNHRFQNTSSSIGREYAGTSILLNVALKQ